MKQLIEVIKLVADKNYDEGKESDLVLVKTDLSSREDQNISLANVQDYEKLIADDFIIVNDSMCYQHKNNEEQYFTISKQYNSQTGDLTLGKQKSYGAEWQFWNTYDLYMVKRNTLNTQNAYISEENKDTEEVELQEFKNRL